MLMDIELSGKMDGIEAAGITRTRIVDRSTNGEQLVKNLKKELRHSC